MVGLPEVEVHCPYCGEPVTLIVDDSVPEQSYVEDCFVCCQPITVVARAGFDGELAVEVRGQDDT